MCEQLPAPVVCEQLLDKHGFSAVEDSTETFFEGAVMCVRGRTIRYEDEKSRHALAEATNGRVDRELRFLAVTRLQFKPSLPQALAPSLVASKVRSEVRSDFPDQLREQGLESVERGRSDRVRLDDGRRVRVRTFTAEEPLGEDGERTLSLSFRVAVLVTSGTIQILTSGFPAAPLAEQFDVSDPSPPMTKTASEYESDFVEILDGVQTKLSE